MLDLSSACNVLVSSEGFLMGLRPDFLAVRRLPLIAVLALVVSAPAFADGNYATNLKRDARRAARDAVPILVMFSAEYCAYCKVVKEYYLDPMAHDSANRKRVIVRIVEIDSAWMMIDFDGKRVFHDTFAANQAVALPPTLKFYDAQGREILPEIQGSPNHDLS